MDPRAGRSSKGFPALPGGVGRAATPGFRSLLATILLALPIVMGCGSVGPGRGSSPPGPPDRATVVQVIDGDTVELDFDGHRERVRLLGVDAPESVHPTVPVQCFGPEASAALGRLLPQGSEVVVERDIEARDRYDRLLLYLHRAEDSTFVNHWLVANGLADTSFYEPNTTRSAELRLARSQARAAGTGLWSRCDGPDQPLDPMTDRQPDGHDRPIAGAGWER